MTEPDPISILLVEDEPADAYLVRVAFTEGKVLVNLHHVRDGVEAFDFLQRKSGFEHAPRPDLILLDLNMPRMDGRQFLSTIKQDPELVGIPVVVLTTSDAESDLVASYEHNAAGYIVKPIDIDEFVRLVRGLSHYWLSIVNLPENP